MLAAYDSTGSLCAAADLAECSHQNVAAHVAARDAGLPLDARQSPDRVTDPFLPKIEEWIEESRGRIQCD